VGVPNLASSPAFQSLCQTIRGLTDRNSSKNCLRLARTTWPFKVENETFKVGIHWLSDWINSLIDS
jgi:hypothetical protein